jgi:hypothetical protein
LSTSNSPLVRAIVPLTAKLMASPSLALASACRNEPGPLSFVFDTVIVPACSWITTAQNNSTPTAMVMLRLNKRFVSLCCSVGESKTALTLFLSMADHFALH